jgi:hypothetical protein
MMISVAIIGVELALISTLESAIDREHTVSGWLASAAVVVGLQIVVVSLVRCYLKKTRIIEVITYKGPLTYDGRVLRKEDSRKPTCNA